MSDIFISYFHRDRPVAESLAAAFEAGGLSVWWDREIPAGATFDKTIEDALTGAAVVVVLWSNESVQSRWVRNEAEDAAGRNLLVPVLIDADVRIPLAFKSIQCADFVGWDGEPSAPAFENLIADIRERIAARRTPAPTPAPPITSPDSPVEEPTHSAPARAVPLLETRAGLTTLLAAVFCANYLETFVETILQRRYGIGGEFGARIAVAFRGLERNLSFESHDLTNWFAVYGYSVAYFFLLPVVGMAVIAALMRRNDLRGYRLLAFAVAADYAISVGFFVFFPVPERWTYSGSDAILLSDRWSSHLIEMLRPISGLDNCFPSSHVSLTVIVILVGYLSAVRLRHTVFALGVTIIVSTLALGIHWIPDIIAGIAVGVLSVAVARYISLPRAHLGRRRRRTAMAVAGSPAAASAPAPDYAAAL